MTPEMRFITIGYIEPRKGQDILVDAIFMLPERIVSRCSFTIIGQDGSMLAHSLRKRIKDKPWVEMTGPVSRDRIHEIMNEADVLICPSREDPMPTVCAEAMMHSLPCIVSDAVGTAAYISNEYDGFIFQSQNAKELCDKISWCMSHRSELPEMGKRAYEIYERFFSIRAFEKKLLGIVGGFL